LLKGESLEKKAGWWFLPVMFVISIAFALISKVIDFRKLNNCLGFIISCVLINEIVRKIYISVKGLAYYLGVLMTLLWYSVGYFFWVNRKSLFGKVCEEIGAV